MANQPSPLARCGRRWCAAWDRARRHAGLDDHRLGRAAAAFTAAAMGLGWPSVPRAWRGWRSGSLWQPSRPSLAEFRSRRGGLARVTAGGLAAGGTRSFNRQAKLVAAGRRLARLAAGPPRQGSWAHGLHGGIRHRRRPVPRLAGVAGFRAGTTVGIARWTGTLLACDIGSSSVATGRGGRGALAPALAGLLGAASPAWGGGDAGRAGEGGAPGWTCCALQRIQGWVTVCGRSPGALCRAVRTTGSSQGGQSGQRANRRHRGIENSPKDLKGPLPSYGGWPVKRS